MVKMQCKDLVLHFNKKHLEDPTIPMWVVKTKGDTFYVNHITSSVPWSTKETPGNQHTKGSIKIKNCLLVIDDNNSAEISALSEEDKKHLKVNDGPHARVIIDSNFPKFRKYLYDNNIEHSTIKKITGGCSTLFYICDIMKKEDMALLAIVFAGSYRILRPNEEYYKWYTDAITAKQPGDITESLFGKIKSIFSNSDKERDIEHLSNGDDYITDITEYDMMDDDDE